MEWMPSKIDWNKDDKYNFGDLNRVENNTIVIKLLAEILRGDINLEGIELDRNVKSIPFADNLNKIERNIDKLGNVIYKPKGWIDPIMDWVYDQPFNYLDANRLERNLLLLYKYTKGNVDKIPKCGTIKASKGRRGFNVL